MNTFQLLTAWRKSLHRRRLSEHTINLRLYYLQRFAQWFARPLTDARLTDLETWMSGHDWSDNTIRTARASLSTFFEWARSEGHILDSPARHLVVVREGPPLPHPCPDRVYEAALARAEPYVRLMCRIAAEAGGCRAEVAQVHRDDVRETLGGGVDLLIHGKGGKDRLVPISHRLAQEIAQRGAETGGYLFPSPCGTHLTPAHVGELVKRVLGDPRYTMHSLRHRYATKAYAKSLDIVAVKELLGHTSVETTLRYVGIGADRLRQVALYAS